MEQHSLQGPSRPCKERQLSFQAIGCPLELHAGRGKHLLDELLADLGIALSDVLVVE
jgi:hypothetical protein